MKHTFLLILFCVSFSAFSQTGKAPFERLRAYSTKSDIYDMGFFFTLDSVLLSYSAANVYGDEKQISQDHSPLKENTYTAYNTFSMMGEMGFINTNRHLIYRDSVNRIFTSVYCQFTFPSKKWDTISFTKNYYNENWKVLHSDKYIPLNKAYNISGSKFYQYDKQSRLIKDSSIRLIQNVLLPDTVRCYAYDEDNNIILDSVSKYTNNIAVLQSANYYKYENRFLTERRFLQKSGVTQVWEYYKDNNMLREYSYTINVNQSKTPLHEFLKFYDVHDSMIEYITIKLNNNTHDTTNHSKYEYVYDNNGNAVSKIFKRQYQTGNWINIEKNEYAYNSENLMIENVVFRWNGNKNDWFYQTKSTYEYNKDAKIVKENNYGSKDSVSWLGYDMTVRTYTDYGNPSKISAYEWDTLINDYFPVSFTNYYWEKYFYDENIIDTNNDLFTAVYPNPFDDVFNLVFECETDGHATIRIFNISGIQIASETITVKKQMNNFRWDASACPAGMYIVNITNGLKEKSLKIMKGR